jgi:hypothetical protein
MKPNLHVPAHFPSSTQQCLAQFQKKMPFNTFLERFLTLSTKGIMAVHDHYDQISDWPDWTRERLPLFMTIHGSPGAVRDWIHDHVCNFIRVAGWNRLQVKLTPTGCYIYSNRSYSNHSCHPNVLTIDLANQYTSRWEVSDPVRRQWGSWVETHERSPFGTADGLMIEPLLWYPDDPCHSHAYLSAMRGHPIGQYLCDPARTRAPEQESL